MKNFKYISIICFIFVTFSMPKMSYAMDPRIKALGITAAYGTIGGALLGTASLAFGTSGRSVAKGASLGLYAGLLFGGYVVLTHYLKNQNQTPSGDGEYYPDTEGSPYEGEGNPDEEPVEEQEYELWRHTHVFESSPLDVGFSDIRWKSKLPPLQIELLRFNF